MRPTETMPTAGKAVAAVGLGLLAYYASGIVIEIWPDETQFGYFRYGCAALGVLMGWRVIGRRVGRGIVPGIGAGITGLFALLFWCFLLFSFYEMITRSLGLRYKGPVEAILGMFDIAWRWAENIADPRLLLTLLLGAMAVGLVAELVSRKAS